MRELRGSRRIPALGGIRWLQCMRSVRCETEVQIGSPDGKGGTVIEILKDLPEGIVGVRAIGKVSKEDYEKVLVPLFDEARREGRHLRFLYQLGPQFEGFTPGAAWEDAKIGLHSLRLFDGCAVVSDAGWIRESTRGVGFFMPCPVRIFGNKELPKAIGWLSSLSEPAVSHRVLPDSGVIVVEV